MEQKKTIEVSAAILFRDGCLFATQRGYGEWKDWWELPGGKREAGETLEECLKREIKEELDTDIEVGEELICVEYDYPTFHLTMHCFHCQLLKGKLALLEHEAACWLSPAKLYSVQWLPADEIALPVIKEKLLSSHLLKNRSQEERGI